MLWRIVSFTWATFHLTGFLLFRFNFVYFPPEPGTSADAWPKQAKQMPNAIQSNREYVLLLVIVYQCSPHIPNIVSTFVIEMIRCRSIRYYWVRGGGGVFETNTVRMNDSRCLPFFFGWRRMRWMRRSRKADEMKRNSINGTNLFSALSLCGCVAAVSSLLFRRKFQFSFISSRVHCFPFCHHLSPLPFKTND